jgi:hypothetical protein
MMTRKNDNLMLFEAIELRSELDRHIKLLESLIGEIKVKRERLFTGSDEDEDKEPATGFDIHEIEERLKKLQKKKVKLNQAIQSANFNARIDHDQEKISIAEALEVRKSLQAEEEVISKRVVNSAYNKIIHKEERDIVRKPTHPFLASYEDYKRHVTTLRRLVTRIHSANHNTEVVFTDE